VSDESVQVAQELERARSLAQRGTLLAGANIVTVAVLLQTMGVLVSPGMASQADARFTLLLALLCFTVAAISAAITDSLRPAAASGGGLKAAQDATAKSTELLTAGAGFDVGGMLFLALTAVLFVF
jgi:hypothetical protein